jgi:hypothetical protein
MSAITDTFRSEASTAGVDKLRLAFRVTGRTLVYATLILLPWCGLIGAGYGVAKLFS